MVATKVIVALLIPNGLSIWINLDIGVGEASNASHCTEIL